MTEAIVENGIETNPAICSNIKQIGSLLFDCEEHSVSFSTEKMLLTEKEFNILFLLLSNPKKAFNRSRLMGEPSDINTTSTLRSVDVCIAKLRKKFSECHDFEIVTVHGLGYKAIVYF